MLILVCGSRYWTDPKPIRRELERFNPATDTIMHGGARGADTIAGNIAFNTGFLVNEVRAQWDRYGRAAGPKRNERMLNKGPDLVLAFTDNLDTSKGTRHMVNIARAAGVKVEVFNK